MVPDKYIQYLGKKSPNRFFFKNCPNRVETCSPGHFWCEKLIFGTLFAWKSCLGPFLAFQRTEIGVKLVWNVHVLGHVWTYHFFPIACFLFQIDMHTPRHVSERLSSGILGFLILIREILILDPKIVEVGVECVVLGMFEPVTCRHLTRCSYILGCVLFNLLGTFVRDCHGDFLFS